MKDVKVEEKRGGKCQRWRQGEPLPEGQLSVWIIFLLARHVSLPFASLDINPIKVTPQRDAQKPV